MRSIPWPSVIVSTAALLASAACEDQSQRSAQPAEGVVTVSQRALATTNDITVGYIQRNPIVPWVENSSNPTVEGWPAVGEVVTWRGFVRNFGPARTGVQVRWFVDNILVLTGTTALPANGTAQVTLARPWDFARHAIRLELDGNNAVAEEEESNNSLTVDSDAISVGFWVEQGVYDYFRDHQRDLNVGSSCWDNWAQRHIARANRMFAAALSPDNPAGAVDRWRLDKITIVADGLLPLTGCCYAGNNPDSNDKTTDLQWGFPASLVTGDMYQDTTTIAESNPFYYEGSLLHELGHARYLVDGYTWNVHSDPGNNSLRIPINEGGSNIVGTRFLPMVRNDVVYYSHHFGLMNGGYSFLDHLSASALNLIAGRRATLGNQNVPGNFAVYMNDLPAENRLTLLDNATGAPLAGASVSVYQVTEEFYSSTPVFTRTTDAAGRVLLGRNPFTPFQVSEGSNVMLLRVAHTNGVRYQFMESSDFNREYWRGHTAQGEYTMRVDFRNFPARLSFAPTIDATVREASPTSNFGTATTLDVINTPGASRWIYLRFPITGATGEITALLRLHGSRPVASENVDQVFSVSNNTWTETGITWNNRPANDGQSGEVKVDTTPGYWDLDVTWPVQGAINDGASTVNLVVKMRDSMTGSPDSFVSREGPAATRPQLIIAPQDKWPTVTTAAAASPSTVTGATSALSVLGSDDSGEQGLSYQWSVIDSPPVSFSPNDSNAAKNTTATFQAGGPHRIRVTIVDGLGHTVESEVTVTVNAPTTSVVAPVADAYVRDGTNAGVNFGSDPSLAVKVQSTAGNTRWSYLRFPLSTVSGTVTSAKLRLHGSRPSAGPATDSAFAISSNSWTEGGINWNNRPPLGAAQGRGLVIGAPSFANYYVWDVTPFVKAQKQAGASEVSLAIRMDNNVTIGPDTFNSREAASNRPELVVTALGSGGGCGSPPTVATAASATPNPVTGSTTALSVLGADDGGEPALRYAWSTVGTPPAPVSFSPNLTNAAKNSTATFTQPGSYNLRVTITDACSQAALSNVTVTVNAGSTTTKLAPAADAHVRDGTAVNTSFGTATALEQKNSTVAGNHRRTFLRFSIGSLGSNITAAKLRLHGASVTTAKLVGVFSLANVTWGETVTWNTAPMIGSKLGSSKSVGTTAAYVEWDVTAYLQTQKASGATAVSFEMKQDTANNETPTSWSSREAAGNRPELEVTTGP